MSDKFEVKILFGEEACNKLWDGSDPEDYAELVDVFEFDTEQEKDAFCSGVLAGSGWMTFEFVE